MAIVIADSGSTKTHWVELHDDLTESEYNGEGINPYVHTSQEINQTISSFKGKLDKIPDRLYFYGAGCSSPDVIQKVELEFAQNNFENVQVSHDLLAASQALFKRESGIACILGTGSNSALYNGEKIIDNIPALGYIVGDEGGGVDLGKRLLISIFKRKAPTELIDKFQSEFDLSVSKMLNAVHFGESPNRFLASFSPFIKENIQIEFIRDLVHDSFTTFIRNNVLPYEKAESYKVAFIGSIAYHFQDVLSDVLDEKGLEMGKVLRRPMPGLIEYYKELLS